MTLTLDTIEAVRLAHEPHMNVNGFCEALDVSFEFYKAMLRSRDASNFPPHAVNRLRGMMLKLEKANLERYKDRLSKEHTKGHFSGTKVLHHLERVRLLQSDSYSTRAKCKPVTVEIHPTDVCNHRCPNCVNATPTRPHNKGLLSTDLLPTLMDDLADMGVKAVNLSGGGEPLLHPGIQALIRGLNERGIEVGLITNGTLLGFDKVESIDTVMTIVAHCTYVRISVDAGSQATYKRMHGKAKDVDFTLLCKAVENLVAEKRRTKSPITIGVSFLLTPDNYLDLIKSACIFRDLGVDYFQVKPLTLPPVERIDSGVVFWDSELFDMLVALNSYQTPDFAIYTLGYKFVDMLLNEHTGLPFKACWGHPLYPTITADGSVLVCCDMVNPHQSGKRFGTYGQIDSTVSFRQLWRTDERMRVGEAINTRLCPSNCKLSEANKVLEQVCNLSAEHKNFIG